MRPRILRSRCRPCAKRPPAKSKTESATVAKAQDNQKAIDNAVVDEPVQFPGGEKALLEFIAKNVSYPAIAFEQGIQGRVVVRFKVNADGTVGDVTIRKGLTRECDLAAANVIKKLPRFIPAKQNGKPVPVWFIIPVTFSLQ